MVDIKHLDKKSELLMPARKMKYVLVWCSSGSATLVVDENEFELKPNHVVTITSGQIHYLKKTRSVKGFVLEFTSVMNLAVGILLLIFLVSCKENLSSIEHKPEIENIKVSANNETTNAIETDSGIVYFSFDSGLSWENKSNGLPPEINLTDIAASGNILAASKKRNGIFLFDFQKQIWIQTATRPETSANIDVLNFYKGKIFIGTENDGIFFSADVGKTWTQYNNGLQNLTIRRIVVIDGQLFIGTNGGLYSLSDKEEKWILEFLDNTLQINGIIDFNGDFYIGTNQGVYKSEKQNRNWKQVMKNISLHNMSFDNKNVYALAYNELFASTDKGESWQSAQDGLPKGLYSFQLRQKDEQVFVGQWDGVYKKSGKNKWIFTSKGMPDKFPVTEMVIHDDVIIASSSGWVIDK